MYFSSFLLYFYQKIMCAVCIHNSIMHKMYICVIHTYILLHLYQFLFYTCGILYAIPEQHGVPRTMRSKISQSIFCLNLHQLKLALRITESSLCERLCGAKASTAATTTPTMRNIQKMLHKKIKPID